MRKYIHLTVFISGMTSLAAEFGASRLLGNIFGTSNLVWAVIIGLILVYLTVGYFLGGKWADKSPKAKTMFSLLAWGAFSLGIVPFIASPVLRAAANAFDNLQAGILAGAFLGVLVLFTIPIILMGTASPFAIRLSMEDTKHAGNISGKIYGISTIGSFIGTFLPTLVLIPTIGTTNTFMIFSLLLLVTAIGGLVISSGWKTAVPYIIMIIILVLLTILGTGLIKKTSGQIYETESAYNYIQVLELPDGTRYLRLNEGQGVHSEYHPGHLNYGGPWQQFLSGPFFYQGRRAEDVTRIGIVGLAAGTTARQAAVVFPNVVIDGWEIDPKIVEVGKTFFDMHLPNLNIFVQDGRWGLQQSGEEYDLVVVDAYRPPYIPAHLTTREFFMIVAEHLKPDGTLAINVGRAPGDRRLIDGLATTIGTIFPSIYVMDIPGTFNSIMYATLESTSAEFLLENLNNMRGEGNLDPLLEESLHLTWINLAPAPLDTTIFTDDLSPIEWLTNRLILNYLLDTSQEILE